MDKNKLITDLKNELNYRRLKENSGRTPASIAGSDVLPYNRKNADILYFKQKQKIKRLKEMQKQREMSFLAQANLSEPNSREAYVKLQEEHELEIYTLRRTFTEERNQFRKQKFYVKN